MTIKVTKLRTSSLGLDGTYKNAEHHAKDAIPLIKNISQTIINLGESYDFEWKQGNNVHILITKDDRKVTFRPFVSENREWGIDVLIKVSNQIEVRLFAITQLCDCMLLGLFLDKFFHDTNFTNTYGSKEHRNNSRAEDN